MIVCYIFHCSSITFLDCPSLLNPNQGSVSLSAGQSYASVATYSCDSGFKVVGDATRECQANGTWEGVDPTCEPLGKF